MTTAGTTTKAARERASGTAEKQASTRQPQAQQETIADMNLVQAQKGSSDIPKIWRGRHRCHIDCARHRDVVSPRDGRWGRPGMRGTMRHSPTDHIRLSAAQFMDLCEISLWFSWVWSIWPGSLQERSSGSKAKIKLRFQYFQGVTLTA